MSHRGEYGSSRRTARILMFTPATTLLAEQISCAINSSGTAIYFTASGTIRKNVFIIGVSIFFLAAEVVWRRIWVLVAAKDGIVIKISILPFFAAGVSVFVGDLFD